MRDSNWQTGNQLSLLRDGTGFFPALLAAINAAQVEIRLETYIFEPDETGLAVANALMAAARRGVHVGLLIDGFGAKCFPVPLQQELKAAGVYLLFFRPELSRFSLKRSRLRRLHRKLSCFDGELAFVGGINILNDDDGPDLAPRYDYAVQIKGPAAADVHRALTHQWRYTSWVQLKKQLFVSPLLLVESDWSVPKGGATARLVVRDNARNRHSIERAYLEAIQNAQTEIIIANAYFLPGLRLRKALMRAAKRGVNVVLLLQDERDQALLQYASWAYYSNLINAGVKVYQYKQGFMHAKVAVIDGEWATVGSSNIDPFSLLLAREANLFVKDKAFATELHEDLQRHLQQDTLTILPKHIKQARWTLRVLVWICYGLVRLLMGISGYGGRKNRE